MKFSHVFCKAEMFIIKLKSMAIKAGIDLPLAYKTDALIRGFMSGQIGREGVFPARPTDVWVC